MRTWSANRRAFRDAIFVALLASGASPSGAFGQLTYPGPAGEPLTGERCGTHDPTPEEKTTVQEAVDRWLAKRPETPVIAAICTIPVAVHVVRSSSGAYDVTDTQINNQISVLNSAYAGTNFRFSLASIDRTDNTAWSQHSMDSAEETAMKAALAVSPATTLNFYTCNLTSALGYAWFPNDWPETSTRHGVVVKYSTLPGGSLAPYNLGQTGTHEIGHFLGLYHTFTGGCSGFGDFVADTPAEASAAFGCPHGRDTCPSDGLDPIYNFMDYSDDDCYEEFTAGQSDRADVQMAVYRPAMLNFGQISIWVDFDYSGPESGSYDRPYNTLAEAHAAATSGDIVGIHHGSSDETLTLSKQITCRAVGGTVTIGQ